ncbi:MAG TPA: phytoene/squalene synthase family protein [Tepidisphaeraceae bacterium]|nr:phytoene/squalene synthase family protein [Tepidisphaeraceae bacterium]
MFTSTSVGQRVAPTDLRSSVAHCRELVRISGSSFYQGMRLIAEPLRTDTFILYSWLRHADDLADNTTTDLAEKGRQLCWFSEYTCRAYEGHVPTVDAPSMLHTQPLWAAFTDLVQRHTLPLAPLQASIRGQFADLNTSSYASFESLREYCYNVASTVGLLCIELWGYDGGEATRELAIKRGLAFQLTNIVRDVREDALVGRVYLPTCFTEGGVTPADVLAGRPNVLRGIDCTLEQAQRFYAESAPLDALVSPHARRCLWAMTERYGGLLRKIAADPSAVLAPQRVRLNSIEKFGILVKAMLR